MATCVPVLMRSHKERTNNNVAINLFILDLSSVVVKCTLCSIAWRFVLYAHNALLSLSSSLYSVYVCAGVFFVRCFNDEIKCVFSLLFCSIFVSKATE